MENGHRCDVSISYCLCCVYCTDETSFTQHPHDDKPRPYLCTVCDKRFTQKGHLNDHRERHTGENVYSCTQCEKRFPSRNGLYEHMNIHSGKYKCTECGQCCGNRHDLAIHRRSHKERNHLNVLFVANNLHELETLSHTAEFTVERNHTNVTCVTRCFVSLNI